MLNICQSNVDVLSNRLYILTVGNIQIFITIIMNFLEFF